MSWPTALVASLLTGLAVLWVLPPRPDMPAAGLAPTVVAPRSASAQRVVRLVLAAGCGAGAWVLVGGPAGPVAGLVVAVVAARLLSRVEPASVVRRRERLERDLPGAVDLLAACLDAGAAAPTAMRTVGRAVGGPVEEELSALGHRLDLGADPAAVWADVARHPQLGPLGAALGRAHESGASVTDAVHQLSEDLREDARSRVEERARSLEVKVAAPLGLCLLPAFVVLGIVPLVVGIVGTLSLR